MLEHQNNKTCYAKNFLKTVPAECRKFFKIFLKRLHTKRYKLTFQEQYILNALLYIAFQLSQCPLPLFNFFCIYDLIFD